MFFPVGIFYYFNLPDFYDNYVTQKKSEIFPPDEETHKPPTSLEGIKEAYQKIREDQRRETERRAHSDDSNSAS